MPFARKVVWLLFALMRAAIETNGIYKGVVMLCQRVAAGKNIAFANKAKTSLKGTVTMSKRLSPIKLMEKARRRIGLNYLQHNFEVWDFFQVRDKLGRVIDRIDVRGVRYEVLTWTPGKSVTTKQVRKYFKALGADGNTAAFIAWITKRTPNGFYASIPSRDGQLYRRDGQLYRPSGSIYLCAPSFRRARDLRASPAEYTDIRVLTLEYTDLPWSPDCVFVAFRAITA